MTNLGHWFRNQGKSILDGFVGGIEDGADGVWHWVTVTLPDNFDRAMTNLGHWIRNQGKSIVDGFVGGLKSAWDTVWKAVSDFCSGFIKGFTDALGIHSPSTIMAEIGRSLLQGLVNGIWDGVRWVWDALSSLATTIGGFFSDAGSWLVSAGYNILIGLYNGLISAWNSVTSFIGGIGSWIADHKGPIEVDRVLLAPHGNAIMDGLLGGLKQGGGKVQSYLDNFTTGIGSTNISGSMSMTGSGSGGLAGGVGSGRGGGTTVINVTVQGTVVAERDLQSLMQKLTLQYAYRNASNGLRLGV
jgi:phage-related protein